MMRARLVIGIIYYLGILRNTQKTRELTLQSQELTRKTQEHAARAPNPKIKIYDYNHLRPYLYPQNGLILFR